MSTSKKKKLRRDIVKYGKKLLGVRYQSTGKNPSQGFDCSGFTSYVYQHFGISIGSSSRAQAQEGKRIAVQKAQEGDLIIFADKGRINHVAMVVSNDSKGLMVIHSTSRGIVVDDMLQSKYWKPRMMYARTILGQ